VEKLWTWEGTIMTVEQAKTLKVGDLVLTAGLEICQVLECGHPLYIKVLTPRDTVTHWDIESLTIPTNLTMALL
jgi:hypothetical protein